MLYQGGETQLSLIGISLVMLSSLSYSIYIIGVNKSVINKMNAVKITFWATVFGTIVLCIRLNFLTDLQALDNYTSWGNSIGLALFPTVISLICMAIAINKIGSTFTSILGSFEPITALIIGATVFSEPLTQRIIIGVVIIIIAVTFIIAGNPIIERFKHSSR